MPEFKQDYLPGTYGGDYRFVSYGGKVYVVYRVEIPGGGVVHLSWRIPQKDLEHYGATRERIRRITRDQFRRLQFFGEVSEITSTEGPDKHPFEKWLRELRETYEGASWLEDPEVLGVMLSGLAEGLDPETLAERLENTEWYQSLTDRQREWEEMSKAQRKAELKAYRARMLEYVEQILGEGFTVQDLGISTKEFEKAVFNVTSGAWGDPEFGFLVWSSKIKRKAEKVKGTAAWIERQQEIEEQRAFMNRPEEVMAELRSDAFQWLGPNGVPADDVLRSWAQDLVSKKRTVADWEQYLRSQASALYPFLGPEERWVDRAGSYKQIYEKLTGTPIGWDHPILAKIGAVDAKGQYTGQALQYDDFERLVRQTDDFWTGPVARDETFSFLSEINAMFRGVR